MCAVSLHGFSWVSQNNGTNPSHVGNFPLEHKWSFLFSSALFSEGSKINFSLNSFIAVNQQPPHQHSLFCSLMTWTWTAARRFSWSFTLQVELPLNIGKAGNVLWQPAAGHDRAFVSSVLPCLCAGVCQAVTTAGKGQLLPAAATDTTLPSHACSGSDRRRCDYPGVSPPWISIPALPLLLVSLPMMDTAHASLLVLEAAKLNLVYVSEELGVTSSNTCSENNLTIQTQCCYAWPEQCKGFETGPSLSFSFNFWT